MASQTNDDDPVDVGESRPLREWLEAEMIIHRHAAENHQSNRVTQPLMVLIRKTTVAYAVAVLLQEAISIAPLTAEKVSLDNFTVRTKKHEVKDNNQKESFCAQVSHLAADDIILGVDMISEKLSLAIIQPSDGGRTGGKNCIPTPTRKQQFLLGIYANERKHNLPVVWCPVISAVLQFGSFP
jgi:hypothetical protein